MFFSAGVPLTDITATGSTTSRSLPDRFAEIKNVKDFGAVGNSNATASTGADDTVAIQAAVAAVEAQGGGVIFFPPGTYLITAPITFDSNVVKYNFRGVGNARLSGGEAGGSCIVGNFAGFLLDRNNINTTGARVIIENLGIRNHHNSGSAIRLHGVGASTISHCAIQAWVFGIKMGALGQPVSRTFTGNSSGTTLAVSAASGTIWSAAQPLPIPISGTGVVMDTRLMSQSTGTSGSNGNYITDIASTCSGSTVTTHPNAPTAFTSVIEHCVINGAGTYNANPALSFSGVGVQLGTNSSIRECHLNNWGTAIRHYGSQSGITSCQMETNTNAVVIGIDGEGNPHLSTALTIMNCAFESNYKGIWIYLGNQISIQSNLIQVNVDASHNSLYGIHIDAALDVKIETTIVSGTLTGNGVYLGSTVIVGEIRRIRLECCDIQSIGKESGINWSSVTAQQVKGIYSPLSCTLAQLNTAIAAGDVNAGEVRIISDANTVLGSQVHNAVVTGLNSNLARVWYDGTTVRYG